MIPVILFIVCIMASSVGAIVGAAILKRIDNKGVEKILKILLLLIVAMDFYNILKYTIL